jgi:hypothetical protein
VAATKAEVEVVQVEVEVEVVKGGEEGTTGDAMFLP